MGPGMEPGIQATLGRRTATPASPSAPYAPLRHARLRQSRPTPATPAACAGAPAAGAPGRLASHPRRRRTGDAAPGRSRREPTLQGRPARREAPLIAPGRPGPGREAVARVVLAPPALDQGRGHGSPVVGRGGRRQPAGAPAAGAPAQAAGVAGVGWPCLRRAWRREPLRPRRGRCGSAMSECRPGPRPMTRPPDSRRRGAAVATASPTGRSEGRLSRYISRRASRSATQSCPSRPARALPRFWRITQRTSGSGDPIHRSRARRPSSGSATAATHQQ